MEGAMQNMAMQAAANAASASASGVAAGAAAGAAAAAAQAGLAASVAGAAQSAGIAGAATAGAAATAATAATAMAVASAAGIGFLGGSNATGLACAYPNLGFREGNITMFMEGIPRRFTDRESRLVEDVLLHAYNNASGICLDIFQREMLNTTLVEQKYYDMLGGSENVLETTFTSWVKCESCPNEEPLFAYFAQERRLKRALSGISTLSITGESKPQPMQYELSSLGRYVKNTWVGCTDWLSHGDMKFKDDAYHRDLKQKPLIYIDASDFFREFIETVIMKIKAVTEQNDNMVGGFQQIQFAYTTDDEDNERASLTVNLTQTEYQALKAEIEDSPFNPSNPDSPSQLYGPVNPLNPLSPK